VAVVAGAPDVTEVRPVLNDASEARADCSKSPQFSTRRPNQDSRLTAEPKYLPTVGFHILGFD